MRSMTERNDEQVRRMTEERMKLEADLSSTRSELQRIQVERDQKSTQLDIMGQTLEGAATEAKKSMSHVETLQASLNQCAKEKNQWLTEKSMMETDIRSKEISAKEVEAARGLERSNWQQERDRFMSDIDNLHKQMKQRMAVSADQQNTIEHFRRMETQWNLEKASLEQEIASVRAQLAQTEEDLGFQLQAQEKSLQHAKEALGATESSLNNRLMVLEKELTSSQVDPCMLARERSQAL